MKEVKVMDEYYFDFNDESWELDVGFDEDCEEDYMDFDDDGWDLEVGYDPYMGCYSDDC
jgi:hypothetical protein